jgi:hypothetical protein
MASTLGIRDAGRRGRFIERESVTGKHRKPRPVANVDGHGVCCGLHGEEVEEGTVGLGPHVMGMSLGHPGVVGFLGPRVSHGHKRPTTLSARRLATPPHMSAPAHARGRRVGSGTRPLVGERSGAP